MPSASSRAVVDIATLTGACVIALGGVRSGLFATDDALANALLAAGERRRTCAGACRWTTTTPRPENQFCRRGQRGGRAGGAITAAKFLQRFAAKYPWAHLDIAGTAWKAARPRAPPVALWGCCAYIKYC
jgi:leucyl aminopeptidase